MNFILDQKDNKTYQVPIYVSLIRKSSSLFSKGIYIFELDDILDHGNDDHDKDESNNEEGNNDNDVDDDYDDHDDDGHEDDDCYVNDDNEDCDIDNDDDNNNNEGTCLLIEHVIGDIMSCPKLPGSGRSVILQILQYCGIIK